MEELTETLSSGEVQFIDPKIEDAFERHPNVDGLPMLIRPVSSRQEFSQVVKNHDSFGENCSAIGSASVKVDLSYEEYTFLRENNLFEAAELIDGSVALS